MIDDATAPEPDEPGGFDPGEPFEAAAAPPEPMPEPIRFGTGAVKKALIASTSALNGVAGETVHADLTMTDFEAGLIAPGVVKYLEARPRLAATVAAGGNEYLQAAVGMGVYGVRVARERAKALAEQAEQADAASGAAQVQAPIIIAGSTEGGDA